MLKRYLVRYVGQDSHDHQEVVWASDHKQAAAKVKERGGEMVRVVRRLMNPIALVGIYLAILSLVVLAIVKAV